MTVETLTMPVSEIRKNITCEITLTGMRTWKIRLSIGCLLFKLAAYVAGMKGIVKVGNQTLGEMK